MIKRFIAFLKGLFFRPLTPEEEHEVKRIDALRLERDAYIKEKLRLGRLTHAERRYEWLCSTGYTPRVHLGTEPRPDPILSGFRVMVNKCKNKGYELRKAGKRVIQLSSRKNKWGIDLEAYNISII